MPQCNQKPSKYTCVFVILVLFEKGTSMNKWQCMTCGFIYDEAEGLPDDGIKPGTKWEDVPEDWICPECGTPKEDFEMVEID